MPNEKNTTREQLRREMTSTTCVRVHVPILGIKLPGHPRKGSRIPLHPRGARNPARRPLLRRTSIQSRIGWP